MELIKFSSSIGTKRMEPKFKLYLNSEKFLRKIRKEVAFIEGAKIASYMENSRVVQDHFKNAEKLLAFINSLTDSNDYKYTLELFILEGFYVEVRLFQEISKKISESKSISETLVLPCYKSEIYDFFEFSRKQKDENTLRVKYFQENAENLKANPENVFTLSALILIFQNFKRITKYLIAVREIKDTVEKLWKMGDKEILIAFNDDGGIVTY